MADTIEGPTAWERIKQFLRPGPRTPEEEEAERRASLEAMHGALPDELSARSAIMRDRERKRRLDEQTRE